MTRIREILSKHEHESWAYGDGYNEPQESGDGCTCGVVYDEWQQHRCEDDCPCRDTDPVDIVDAHSRHLLAVLIRARLLRSASEVSS